MSAVATAWAWQQSNLDMVRKFILVAYAESADDQACAAPTREHLQTLTLASETTVIRATRELVEAGYLTPVEEIIRQVAGSGSRLVTRYRLGVSRSGPPPLAPLH